MTARIKRLIVDRLDLPTPGSFDESMPLFDGGLGMDSFVAVELITLMEAEFDIKFDPEDVTADHFKDVSTLARLVERYLAGS